MRSARVRAVLRQRERRPRLPRQPAGEFVCSCAHTLKIERSTEMSKLFEPFTLRGVTLRNRVGVSPMCQYSSEDGLMTDWHLVHLGSRALGGAGLVITEAAAVEARGRITPQDAGIWKDEHIAPMARITAYLKKQGAVPSIQLAHAGRKASTRRPWDGSGPVSDAEGGWEPVGPSALPFEDGWRVPRALTIDEIQAVQTKFVEAARRAQAAGFEWFELHAAHGYLAHEFLSPLSNTRADAYGGSFENRIRFTVETAKLLRDALPAHLPLTVRLSCTDWAEGGWTLDESIALSVRLKAVGVDLIDCSSGGNLPHANIPVGPGYQVPFAEAIKQKAGIPTAAVGMITEPAQADEIIQSGRADLVLLARASLRDPYWPVHAARALGEPNALPAPPQYLRAF